MSTVARRKSIVVAASEDKCGFCKNIIIDKKEPSIQCDVCSKWNHIPCSGLKDEEVQPALDDSTIAFTCVLCKSTTAGQIPTMQYNMIMKRFDDIVESHNKMEGKFSLVKEEAEVIRKEYKEMKKVVVGACCTG